MIPLSLVAFTIALGPVLAMTVLVERERASAAPRRRVGPDRTPADAAVGDDRELARAS